MSTNLHEWLGKVVAPDPTDPTSPLDEFHDWASSWLCSGSETATKPAAIPAKMKAVQVQAMDTTFNAVEMAPTLPTPVVSGSPPPVVAPLPTNPVPTTSIPPTFANVVAPQQTQQALVTPVMPTQPVVVPQQQPVA